METQVSSALNNSIGGFSTDVFYWIGYVVGLGIVVMVTITLTFHAIQWFRHIAGLNPPKAPDKQLSGEGGDPFSGMSNAEKESQKAKDYVDTRAGLMSADEYQRRKQFW